MSQINTLSADTHEVVGVRAPRLAALAAWIGSALEYYDFFIYGTAAALVFPKIFFPSSSPQMATLASFATFGVAYVARPLGAVALGHVGDRFGRKKVMIFTLLLMGVSTFIIGLLPTYQQVGILAPILLVAARVLQGISAAGEQAGANSMTLEHAPPRQRSFYTSFTLGGTQAGQILAILVFLPLGMLPEDQLLSWGWRVPFFLSAFVVLVGYWIRRNLPETPVFEQEERERLARAREADQEADAGAAGRIRTVDLRITNALLYRLSYCGFPSGDRCRRKVALEQAASRVGTQLLTVSAPNEAMKPSPRACYNQAWLRMESTNATCDFWTCNGTHV